MVKMTLSEIIEREQERRVTDGDFGIDACKRSIEFSRDVLHESLYEQLEEYVKRSNEDIFFNKRMVLACWEMINEKEGE